MESFYSTVLVSCCLVFHRTSAGLVTSSQTEGTDIGREYVGNVSDNEHCFYNGDDDVHRLPCRAGYTVGQSPGSSCKLCPFEEGGLKTFQPKQNLCEKCILCSECGEGKEVHLNCTRTTDTVCRSIVENPVTKSTTPRDEIPRDSGTMQTDKLPAMETKNRNSKSTTDHPESMAKTTQLSPNGHVSPDNGDDNVTNNDDGSQSQEEDDATDGSADVDPSRASSIQREESDSEILQEDGGSVTPREDRDSVVHEGDSSSVAQGEASTIDEGIANPVHMDGPGRRVENGTQEERRNLLVAPQTAETGF